MHTDLCNCDSCENQSEDISDDIFDKDENEIEITENVLEYESEYLDIEKSIMIAWFEIT